jgi:hypothetical protein
MYVSISQRKSFFENVSCRVHKLRTPNYASTEGKSFTFSGVYVFPIGDFPPANFPRFSIFLRAACATFALFWKPVQKARYTQLCSTKIPPTNHYSFVTGNIWPHIFSLSAPTILWRLMKQVGRNGDKRSTDLLFHEFLPPRTPIIP